MERRCHGHVFETGSRSIQVGKMPKPKNARQQRGKHFHE
jgi:hypothetical protein